MSREQDLYDANEKELARLRENEETLRWELRKANERAAELRHKIPNLEQAALSWRENCEALEKEVARLKRGEFTEEEFQNLCHGLPETCPPEEFFEGCRLYHLKLFGRSPIVKTWP